ncbi:MAG: 30S ribosomal protein S2 [bacterium]|nr:30S ribosomal protein S2 [bacterium]
MEKITVEKLVAAQAHFGHLTSRWNPKMKPYIFTKKNGIHIIDLLKTAELLEKACEKARNVRASGEQILFVGTKKQAKDLIRDEAIRCNQPYVCERWLGGTLTNLQTIRKSVKMMQTIEKQKIDGTYEKLTKKERLYKDLQLEKYRLTLDGIRDMKTLPGALYVVDIVTEEIAVREARRLGIPVIGIVDTNADPTMVDFPIPANDDAFKSIWVITSAIAEAIMEGSEIANQLNAAEVDKQTEEPVKQEDAVSRPRERVRRRERPTADKSSENQTTE